MKSLCFFVIIKSVNIDIKFRGVTYQMVTIVDERYVQVESGSTRYVEILCESTDTKPTEGIATNSLVQELDTNKLYYFDGTAWQEITSTGGGGGGGESGMTTISLVYGTDVTEGENRYILSESKTAEADAAYSSGNPFAFVVDDDGYQTYYVSAREGTGGMLSAGCAYFAISATARVYTVPFLSYDAEFADEGSGDVTVN